MVHGVGLALPIRDAIYFDQHRLANERKLNKVNIEEILIRKKWLSTNILFDDRRI